MIREATAGKSVTIVADFFISQDWESFPTGRTAGTISLMSLFNSAEHYTTGEEKAYRTHKADT